MTNRYAGVLAAMLMVSSSCLAPEQEATQGEIKPSGAGEIEIGCGGNAVPCAGGYSEPLEQQWPASFLAANVPEDSSIGPLITRGRVYWHPDMIAGLNDEATPPCSTSDLEVLEGADLVNYLRTHKVECYRFDFTGIFTDGKMQPVLSAIEELAPAYDGTNSTGVFQLWHFVWIGFWYEHRHPHLVGPFEEATNSAYIAASEAFAANDHLFDFNDEAAEILNAYIGIADRDEMREHRIEQINSFLSRMTRQRMDNFFYLEAYSAALGLIYHGLVNDDRGFIDALSQYPGIVESLLQFTRFFDTEMDNEMDNYVQLAVAQHAIGILGRLATLPNLEDAAIAALTAILEENERFGNHFMAAVENLEDLIDCNSLNICRDELRRELHSKLFPNNHRFDDGALVFESPLDLEEVQTLYQAAKEVKAQFHRLFETDEPAPGAIEDVLHVKIFGSNLEYRRHLVYLFDADISQTFAGGYYLNGIVYLYRANFPHEPGEGYSLEEKFRHEYAHYLAERFAPAGLYEDCHLTWFQESLAEFLMGSTQAEGVTLLQRQVRETILQEHNPDLPRYDPETIFEFCYSGFGFKDRYYLYGNLFFHYLHRHRRTQLLELLDLVRGREVLAYETIINTWTEDSQLAADYSAYVDEQVANVAQLPYPPHYSIFLPDDYDPVANPPRETTFLPLDALASDSAAEIESALQEIDGGVGLNCQTVASDPNPRFGCTGSLPAEDQFSGDRGALNEHLNVLLDDFIASAVDHWRINNFEGMTCYFANISASPEVADLYCEGPLRPMDLPPPGVDLITTLRNDSAALTVNAERALNLSASLRFSERAASNVLLTWSASLPVRLEEILARGDSVACEAVDTTDRTGTLACGDVRDGSTGLDLSLIFTPLQDGSLDFSVAFSADERELEQADNIQWLRELTVDPVPAPQTLAILSGDDQQGPADAQLDPLVVEVRDQKGNLFAGAEITFSVTAGEGTLSVETATTDSSGRAASTLTLGSNPGPIIVEASVSGVEPVAFNAYLEATPDFDGDGEVGFADFFQFADAFGGSDPRFDLDASGAVDFADFFLLADYFGQPARGKLLVLAKELLGLPDGIELHQNAPNPFNSQTTISYSLPAPGQARVEVFALNGQRVAVLGRGHQKAGRHRINWDGRDDRGRPVASGTYLYRLVTPESVLSRKLTLLR